MTKPPPIPELICKIYLGQQLLETLTLVRATVFGRREPNEPAPITRLVRGAEDRVILADLTETGVSRKQMLVSPQSATHALLVNESAKMPLILSGGMRLGPGERKSVELPVGCEIGNKVLRFESVTAHDLQLLSLDTPMLAPGQAKIEFGELGLRGLGDERAGAGLDELELLNWLQASMDVFQSASASIDFLPKAAQAAQLVRLDTVGVLLLQGDQWEVATLSSQAGKTVSVSWRPSQTMLKRVLLERRTFFHVPQDEANQAQSLIGVQSLVAAPILNRKGEIIGALYGERNSVGAQGVPLTIRELEVKLFELLAYGVAAGLARMEQERKLIAERVRFEQFFSPELAKMLETRGDEMLAPRDAEITVLFCDIKGFSRISAQNGAVTAVEWVRDVLSVISDCVADHQGVLIDYSGDALEAIWGAPLEMHNHAERAVQAALAMIAALPEINARWQKRLGDATDLAIGINTGRAQVGNIGSRRKFKYGAFGTTVNLASRVQGATKHVGISLLATKQTTDLLPATIARRRLCTVRTINIDLPTELYEIAVQPELKWESLRQRYEAALARFEQGQFDVAREELVILAAEYPQDEPTRKLRQRAAQMTNLLEGRIDTTWNLESK